MPRTLRRFRPDPNLVFHSQLWKHDGGTFYSDDASGHLCTVTGATWGSQGRTFDGVDDSILLSANVTKGLPAVTVMGWVNPLDTSATYAILGDYTGAADASLVIELQDVVATSTWQLIATIKGEATAIETKSSTTTTRPYGQFAFVSFTWDGTNYAFAVDGVPDGSGTYGVADTLESTVTLNTSIGSYAPGAGKENTKGVIGEIIVYNRSITIAEIGNIYLATKWRYR